MTASRARSSVRRATIRGWGGRTGGWSTPPWATRCRSTTTPAASLQWHNREDDFPAWAGRGLTAHDPTERLARLASGGAISATVASEQLGRLRRSGVTATLATVTMGGNDLLVAYGDATATRNAIQTVADNGRRLLTGLRDLMGADAPIVVATVDDPSDGSGDAGRLGLAPWPEPLERLALLNQALRALATEHRALVADVHARFFGYGLAAGDPTQPAERPAAVACGTAA